jgi:molybdopterin converting factor small subunit
MWDEYCSLRGLDEKGRPTPISLERIGTRAVLDIGAPRAGGGLDDVGRSSPAGTVPAPEPRALGRVTLRSFGPLARSLGAETTIELQLPATTHAVLEETVRQFPAAERWLLNRGHPVPTIQRDGRRLSAEDTLHDGDELDLVLAISGGAA